MEDVRPPTQQKPRYRTAKNFPVKLSVRVTPTERDTLRTAAKGAGMSVSRFLARTVSDRRYPPALKDREALFRTRFLLEKAGANLNQIAHRLNAAAKGAPAGRPALTEIRQIARLVKAVATEVKKRLR